MFKWMNWFSKDEVEKDIFSPNNNIKCHFTLKNGRVSYSVFKNNKIIIKPSFLGFLICGEEPIGGNLKLIREQKKKRDDTIEMPWGEDRFIKDSYNESAFYLTEKKGAGRIFTLRFRIYDNAVAFRYEIPPQPKFSQITIQDELTEFNLDLNTIAWKIPAYQPDRYEYNYEKTMVYDLGHSVHTPLTLRTPNGCYLAIHEAALYNYGSMTIKLNENNILKSDITPLSDGTKAHVSLPFQTQGSTKFLHNYFHRITSWLIILWFSLYFAPLHRE